MSSPAHRLTTLDQRRRLYEDALALINLEYATALELDGVAARLYTSRRQLQRVFSDAGTSFRTAVRRRRMLGGAQLLRARPGLSMREVSQAVGYRQPAQFAKAFRSVYGVSPSEYRAQARLASGATPSSPIRQPAA